MVAGDDDAHDHEHGQCPAGHAQPRVPRLPHQGDPHEQVPSDVETRHRGVGVGEGGRLEHPVGVGAGGDGVEEAEVHQSRRRDREEGHDQHPDQPRHDERVAIDDVRRRAAPDQPAQHGGDHGPVAVDVDGVDDPTDAVDPERRALEVALREDPEHALEPDDVTGVGGGGGGISGGQAADREVDRDGGGEVGQLAGGEGPAARQRRVDRSAATPVGGGSGGGGDDRDQVEDGHPSRAPSHRGPRHRGRHPCDPWPDPRTGSGSGTRRPRGPRAQAVAVRACAVCLPGPDDEQRRA